MGKYLKDKIEDENNQSFLDGEKGYYFFLENLGEEFLDLDFSYFLSDKVVDVNLGSSFVVFFNEVSDGIGVFQELFIIDFQEVQSFGYFIVG